MDNVSHATSLPEGSAMWGGGVVQNEAYPFRGPIYKVCNILGSISGSPNFGKLPLF